MVLLDDYTISSISWAFIWNILLHSVTSREKHVYTLFELLDEDIVEAAPSFNLIDEENYDKDLEIL